MDGPWMEIDCPVCGFDYDVELDATCCPLGHELSDQVLASANRYDADGNCINDAYRTPSP